MSRKNALLSFAIIFGLILGIQTGLASAQSTVYPVTVNYNLSLVQMIDVGQYDLVDSSITSEHFPVIGVDTKEITTVLVYFSRAMNSKDVLRELDRRGLRPAIIEELLAFGAKYPELQRQFAILALGSVWQRFDDQLVPYLWGGSGGRSLRLAGYSGDRWFEFDRFLAVSK